MFINRLKMIDTHWMMMRVTQLNFSTKLPKVQAEQEGCNKMNKLEYTTVQNRLKKEAVREREGIVGVGKIWP